MARTRKKRTKLTKRSRIDLRQAKTKAAFLKAYSAAGFVGAAATAAGVSRTAVYEWKANDPDFSKAWERCEDEATSVLEDVALKRAMQKSDTLLIFMLKAKRPDKYREVLRHSGMNGPAIPFVGTVVNVDQLSKLSDKELNALHGIASKLGGTDGDSDAGANQGGTGAPRS